MSLDDIVQINITTLTTAPTRVGFGTPLVLAFHTVFPERFRIFTNTADMLTDGFVTTDAAFKAASAILAQSPKVTRIIVGRAANAPIQIELITVASVQNSTLYELKINASTFSFTSDVSATAEEIAAGLVTAVNGGTEPVAAADNLDGTFTLTADVAGTLFDLEITDRLLLNRKNTTVDPGVVADITAVQAATDDWFSLHLTSQSQTEIEAAAAFIETQKKIMVNASGDDEILDSGVTTDLGSNLKSSNFARTATLFHTEPHKFGGAAWAGVLLPKDPGAATWKFKTLAGVPTDVLTTTEQINLENKNVNHFTAVAGVSITQQGVTASGEFIDVTRFVDFLRQRMQEFIFTDLANLDKVPFTDTGIGIVEAQIRAALQLGIGTGGLAADPEPIIVVPAAADVSFTDKATRLLPDITFEATLAGAIHAVKIDGVVSV